MTKKSEKINIMSVGISATNMKDALEKMEHWIRIREQHYICVCPNHTIMESQKNGKLRRIVNSAALATPDGMSVVWACKFYGYSNIERVCGSDLMLAFSALAAEKGYTNFFYGGVGGVPEELAEKLCHRFSGLKVVGTYSPPLRPMTPAEDKAVV
jgi:N-acetylglucosaminyldiphosphoundecaprenol N-acetyl-beta-D-mannosaminyltransferase